MLVLEAGSSDDRVRLSQMSLDLLPLVLCVAKRLERQRDGAVDDLHLPASDQLLELDQGEVRLDAGRIAIHQKRYGPRGSDDHGLCVAVAVLLAELDGLVPCSASRLQ